MASINLDEVRRAFNNHDQARRDAARKKRGETMDPYSTEPVPEMPPYRYIREMWSDFLIVESEGRKRGGSLHKVPFEVGEKGSIKFGPEKAVKIEYVELSASAELLWQSPEFRLRKSRAVRSSGNYDSAVDNLIALAGAAPKGGVAGMSDADIVSEIKEIASPVAGMPEDQRRARLTELTTEVAARKRAGKWQGAAAAKPEDKPEEGEQEEAPAESEKAPAKDEPEETPKQKAVGNLKKKAGR